MKYRIIIIMITAVFGLMSVASAELKIASVDTDRLYALCYDRFVLEEQLQKELNEIKLQVKNKEKEFIEKKIDEKSFREYVQNKQKEFKDNRSKNSQALVYKIENAIRETGKNEGYDLIINSSAQVSGGAPFRQKVSPYINGAYDITSIILKKINSNAPAGFDPEKKLKELYGN